MSALVRKEIRLLLPNFAIAMLLTLSVWLIPIDTYTASSLRFMLVVLPFLFCPALVVMMALDSFGREISSGTFSNLLSQPIARSHIWRAKTVLLGTALAIILGAWWLSFLLHAPFRFISQSPSEMAITTMLIVLVAFSGGLWTVMLLRQVAAAFWLTLLVPAALTVSTVYLTEGATTEYSVTVILAAYSIAGFIWARRMFLRAQDVQWTGGEIAMPGWLKLPRLFASAKTAQGRRPRLALLAKEFQLHQSQLVIAGVLALFHLGMIATRKMGGGLKDSPMLEFLTGQFWILWVVMPLLILMRFQDETNCGRVSAWQDHAGLIHTS